MRGSQRVFRADYPLARLPIMLRSSHCHLSGKDDYALQKMQVCALSEVLWMFDALLSLQLVLKPETCGSCSESVTIMARYLIPDASRRDLSNRPYFV